MNDLLSLLKNDEGTGPVKNGRLYPYKDSEGLLTIGFGRCIEKVGISFREADFLLEQSVNEVIYDCERVFDWFAGLNEVRRAVIVSMVYNLGLAGFKQFRKTIGFLEADDFTAAAVEMLDSKWAVQVGDRAVRLSRMLQMGEWL